MAYRGKNPEGLEAERAEGEEIAHEEAWERMHERREEWREEAQETQEEPERIGLDIGHGTDSTVEFSVDMSDMIAAGSPLSDHFVGGTEPPTKIGPGTCLNQPTGHFFGPGVKLPNRKIDPGECLNVTRPDQVVSFGGEVDAEIDGVWVSDLRLDVMMLKVDALKAGAQAPKEYAGLIVQEIERRAERVLSALETVARERDEEEDGEVKAGGTD